MVFQACERLAKSRSSPQDLLRGCYAPPPKGEAKHATSKFVDCGYDWATGKMGALKSVFICPASHRGVSPL